MIFEDGYFGYYAPKNELEKRFQIWWHDEGKFQVPPTKDYNAVKELVKTAWLNGAYVQEELLTKPK
ncbi:hypothetical protein [Sulfuricurvum sp.]|uniref:hypothetical protein n=1 Tax=Sulfuricurvum sp. TaxID=2025608 RepID=UPI002622B01B|nr:hypothetical protein [Sulfuricurvum sp.]MDD2267854.1 hypothetical protein [Sulfuricurvum sp.]